MSAVSTIDLLEGEQHTCPLHLEDSLAFVTGASRMPPLGFDGTAEVRFHEGKEHILPTACTCDPYIALPFYFKSYYDDFKVAMVEGILSGFGFGTI